ncbi:MAG: hypothetical protein NZ821_10020, partial [Gloeomargarita sp. SKYB31]|nr:hypothetical protein [Gloeomargarita sp. SKYB31]
GTLSIVGAGSLLVLHQCGGGNEERADLRLTNLGDWVAQGSIASSPTRVAVTPSLGMPHYTSTILLRVAVPTTG